MAKIDKFLTCILFFVSLSPIFSQIKIIELPLDQDQHSESAEELKSATRIVKSLNEDWTVFIPEYPDERSKANIPCTFEGTSSLIYERDFRLTESEIEKNKVFLRFLGLNYSVEISLNDMVIFKHQMGEIPFDIELPEDILKSASPNKIALKIVHQLDDKITIPLKQRFLFPSNKGGIVRDVNLELIPKVFISDTNIEYSLNEKLNEAKINLNVKFDDSDSQVADLIENNPNLRIMMKIELESAGRVSSFNFRLTNELLNNNDSTSKYELIIEDPDLWSPSSPKSYSVRTQLLLGTEIFDEVIENFAIYSLVKGTETISLNGRDFNIRGTTYIPSTTEYGNMISRQKYKDDLKFIKDLGFNSVRFAKSVPAPYALRLCEEIGLFAFVEIPLNSIHDELAINKEFQSRVKEFADNFGNYYSSFSSVAAIGVGSSYLPYSEFQNKLIKDIAEQLSEKTDKYIYASFVTVPEYRIDEIDFYGIELYSKKLSGYKSKLENAESEIGKNSLFISEALYPSFNGGTNGHLNPNSFESQAKYFNDLLSTISQLKLNAYFISTAFDFSGDYSSFYSGYSDNKEYSVGIVGKDKNSNRLAYKVINSKLNKNSRVTIPIGDKKDDAPIFFILSSLVLSVIMALLINSKRKFREDSTRALLRPYNFFADIRDHRIMSGFHSVILMLIIAATNSLLFTNLFFFFRSNILFEKILLSFGSTSITEAASYLSWHPIHAFVYIFLFTLFMMFLLIGVIKTASLFRKNKVYMSSIYYALVWSLLPLTLLLPIELILYKVLTADAINIFLYIIIAVYMLWLLQRMLKGVYVIFDSHPWKVYLYGILLIGIVVGGTLMYYQISESTFYHIVNAFKQYQLI